MEKIRHLVLVCVAFSGCFLAAAAEASQPGWSLRVITFGEQRREIEATPILQRPYRPLHFYGNTVRRRHYNGTAVPLVPNRPADRQ